MYFKVTASGDILRMLNSFSQWDGKGQASLRTEWERKGFYVDVLAT